MRLINKKNTVILLIIIILVYYYCSKFYIKETVVIDPMLETFLSQKELISRGLKEGINYGIFLEQYARNYPEYYKKVICHKDFIETFLDSIPLRNIMNQHIPMADKRAQLIDLLNIYASNGFYATDRILEKTLPTGFTVNSKTDVIFFLKEYAKLIPMSRSKFDLVTSTLFLDDFLNTSGLHDWETYKNNKDFTLNRIVLLKQAYYYKVTTFRLNLSQASLEDVLIFLNFAKEKSIVVFKCICINSVLIYNICEAYLYYATPEILSSLNENNTAAFVVPNLDQEVYITPKALLILKNFFLSKQALHIISSFGLIILNTILYLIVGWINGGPF